MKKYSIITFVSLTILFSIANLFQSIQVAKACYPWDPDFNPITGECGDPPPPHGLAAVQGAACWKELFDGSGIIVGYAQNCVWAVAGSCSPRNCDGW